MFTARFSDSPPSHALQRICRRRRAWWDESLAPQDIASPPPPGSLWLDPSVPKCTSSQNNAIQKIPNLKLELCICSYKTKSGPASWKIQDIRQCRSTKKNIVMKTASDCLLCASPRVTTRILIVPWCDCARYTIALEGYASVWVCLHNAMIVLELEPEYALLSGYD